MDPVQSHSCFCKCSVTGTRWHVFVYTQLVLFLDVLWYRTLKSTSQQRPFGPCDDSFYVPMWLGPSSSSVQYHSRCFYKSVLNVIKIQLSRLSKSYSMGYWLSQLNVLRDKKIKKERKRTLSSLEIAEILSADCRLKLYLFPGSPHSSLACIFYAC